MYGSVSYGNLNNPMPAFGYNNNQGFGYYPKNKQREA